MDERSYYSESPAVRSIELQCPYCRTRQFLKLRWLIRRKKDGLPAGGDERDRARFAKCESYMVLLDDRTRCGNVRCRKTFEISGVKTMAFLTEMD